MDLSHPALAPARRLSSASSSSSVSGAGRHNGRSSRAFGGMSRNNSPTSPAPTSSSMCRTSLSVSWLYCISYPCSIMAL